MEPIKDFYNKHNTLFWLFSAIAILIVLVIYGSTLPDLPTARYDNGGTCDYGSPCPDGSNYRGDTSVGPDDSSIEGYGWQIGY